MVEPPSAMYVQSRGSVWDMGALASEGEVRTGGAIFDGWSCGSPGLTRPRLLDGFWREFLRGRRQGNMDLKRARAMTVNPPFVEGVAEVDSLRTISLPAAQSPKKKRRRSSRVGPNSRLFYSRYRVRHGQGVGDDTILGGWRVATTHSERWQR